jgi:hypothetical protein
LLNTSAPSCIRISQRQERDSTSKLRERNFVLCQAGAEYFAFVHRTFLEYFCASAIIKRFITTLSMEELQATVPGVHAATLVETLLVQRNVERDFENVFFAADCWREMARSETG